MKKLKVYSLVLEHYDLNEPVKSGRFGFKLFGNISGTEAKRFAKLLRSNASGLFVEELKKAL